MQSQRQPSTHLTHIRNQALQGARTGAISLMLALAVATLPAACDPSTPEPQPTPGAGPTPTTSLIVGNSSPTAGVRLPTRGAVTPDVTAASILGTAIAPVRVTTPSVEATIVLPIEPIFPATTTLPQATQTSSTQSSCAPTREDGEGPFYVPNAPERTSVGEGHVLRGVVKSTRDCATLSRAKIEIWQTNPSAEYDDAHRATLFSDGSGSYNFSSNFPPGYSGRPPHIHVRVSAEGHRTLITQYYPPEGAVEGTFDLVLTPE